MITKTEILKLLQSHKPEIARYGAMRVGLFGSYLHGQASNESDIDILIDFDPEQETFDNLMSISYILEEAFKGLKVDIVTRNGLSPYIGPKILKEVKYV